jgi:single-strand DNA-binding protein
LDKFNQNNMILTGAKGLICSQFRHRYCFICGVLLTSFVSKIPQNWSCSPKFATSNQRLNNIIKMELTGKLTVIGEEKTFNGGFTKREFVLTSEEQYPQAIQFELLKEKGALLGNHQVGQRIKVSFDIRGREWQGKYFNSLVAWKLENAGEQAPTSPPTTTSNYAPAAAPAPVSAFNDTVEDDLPF